MALDPIELYGLGDVRPPFPRLIASGGIPSGTRVLTFAAGQEAPELPVGTPVAYDLSTGFLVPFDQDGMDGEDVIVGFVYPFPVQLHATNEVQGVILERGEVHRDDVNTAAIRAVTGQPDLMDPATEQELDDALLELRQRVGSALAIRGI